MSAGDRIERARDARRDPARALRDNLQAAGLTGPDAATLVEAYRVAVREHAAEEYAAEVARLTAERDEARERLARIAALHVETDDGYGVLVCAPSDCDLPCETGRIARGDSYVSDDRGVTFDSIRALSRWIDEHPENAKRDPEARSWGRLAKLAEESGEVVAAFIGYTGQNPRKGVTHTREDVVKELLDVAITALGAVEHFTEHTGPSSLELLDTAIQRVARRAGVIG